MFPFDPVELLNAELLKNQRPPDGKLHASSHLSGSLRHIQLEMAGAPELAAPFLKEIYPDATIDTASELNLAVGTAIHSIMEAAFRGKPVMQEVKLDQWMPDGWSGTADCIAWDAERRCFVLGDWKSQKSGSLHYIHSGGAKHAHIMQVSAYWHALVDMGLPMLNGAIVCYLPKSQLSAAEGTPVYPSVQEIIPLPREVIYKKMAEQKAAVDAYLASVQKRWHPESSEFRQTFEAASKRRGENQTWAEYQFLTDALAPVSPRVIQTRLNKALKRPVLDVKLVPGWEAAYCPFDNALCNCRTQVANKIGHWDRNEDGTLFYVPRKDVEQPDPIPSPDPAQVAAMVKAQKEKSDGPKS